MTERSPLPIPPQVAAIAPDGNLTPRQRRRLKLKILLRRQRPGTGSAHEFLRRRTAVIEWPDLREILKGIPWVLIGGVATRAYMAERMTKDLDVLVHERDGEEARRRLEAAGYIFLSKLVVPGVLLRSPDGAEIDVIYGRYPWLDKALGHPHHDAAGYPVIALPYLVLLKLWATRDQDWTDITRMLSTATDEQLEEVRAVVKRYSPEDSDDLETMIYLGKREMEMPKQSEKSAGEASRGARKKPAGRGNAKNKPKGKTSRGRKH